MAINSSLPNNGVISNIALGINKAGQKTSGSPTTSQTTTPANQTTIKPTNNNYSLTDLAGQSASTKMLPGQAYAASAQSTAPAASTKTTAYVPPNDDWKDPTKTGQGTGQLGNPYFNYWDPAQEKYVKVPLDQKPTGIKLYTNKYGNTVWGLAPTTGFHSYMDQYGNSMLGEGPDPTIGKEQYMPDPNNNTPVPSGIPNPNYDPNARNPLPTPSGGFPSGYGGTGSTTTTGSTPATTPGTTQTGTPNSPSTPSAPSSPNGSLNYTPAGGTSGDGQGDPNDPFNGTYGPDGQRYWNEDQGTGNFRTDVSPGRTIPENVSRDDGGVQGQFKDSRGNYYNAFAETADQMSPMEVERMQAAFAAKNGRQMTQEELSAYQLNDILKQDSPLMSLARQDGITFANRRGGVNSSLAAGASMAEMARQATPLAMQQAEAYRTMQEQNQNLESQRLEANAGREQQGNMFNADAENQASSQEFQSEAQRRQNNAAMMTDTNIKNAAMSNDMLAKDRSLTMSYALQQLSGDQDLAKQRYASVLAKELAVIEGDYKALISGNDSAARVLTQMTASISEIISNKDISGQEATVKINQMIQTTKDSLAVIGAMNNLDLAGLINPQ